MKKTYNTPKTDIIEIDARLLLAGSTVDVDIEGGEYDSYFNARSLDQLDDEF